MLCLSGMSQSSCVLRLPGKSQSSCVLYLLAESQSSCVLYFPGESHHLVCCVCRRVMAVTRWAGCAVTAAWVEATSVVCGVRARAVTGRQMSTVTATLSPAGSAMAQAGKGRFLYPPAGGLTAITLVLNPCVEVC